MTVLKLSISMIQWFLWKNQKNVGRIYLLLQDFLFEKSTLEIENSQIKYDLVIVYSLKSLFWWNIIYKHSMINTRTIKMMDFIFFILRYWKYENVFDKINIVIYWDRNVITYTYYCLFSWHHFNYNHLYVK